jgi:hypothetical protein
VGYDYAAQQVIAPEREIGTFLTSQKRPFLGLFIDRSKTVSFASKTVPKLIAKSKF